MPTTQRDVREQDRPRLRSIALPVEHGGWGFTLEPILLGLLVAPSPAAWEVSVAALGVFLARRPAKLLGTDLVRRRWLPRTFAALWFFVLYGVIAAAGVAGAIVTAEASFWSPIVVAAPLAAVAVYADAHTRNRTAVAELAGAIAMGGTVTVIALADGWESASAYGLWLVLGARAVTTIALVRGQIRRVHGREAGERTVNLIETAALAVMVGAAAAGWVPWLAVIALGGIGIVAVVSLSRPPVAAKTVGWTQMAVGLGVVLLTAAGARLDF